jgi:hypothetical protein
MQRNLQFFLIAATIAGSSAGAELCSYSPAPKINRDDSMVKVAFRKLSLVKPKAFFHYRIQDNYGVAASPEAENFLTQLCGEYRDNPQMITAKIRWVSRMYSPLPKPQMPIDPMKDLWPQISAYSYSPWLAFSHALWLAKRNALLPTVNPGVENLVVEGSSVCETKYIFAEYIAKSRVFDALGSFRQGLEDFSRKYCSVEDRRDYYDYRGDSNFKPYSPEANAMIFYSNGIARKCKGLGEGIAPLTDKDCQNYFLKPFASRFQAAHQGLLTWLNYPAKYSGIFEDEESMVVVLPSFIGGPYGYRFHLGGSEFLTEKEAEVDLDRVHLLPGFSARVRGAINRHADWRFSAYNDGFGFSKKSTYSPFVASSYEVSQSDLFTQPGATVEDNSDGRKRWMFIFRIHREDLYNKEALNHGDPIHFNEMWLDENSIGTNSLTQSEKAWDKLGTPNADELDSILYLYNIDEDGLVDESGDVVDLGK